jgi:SNF2 family DNA or RNA helicase
VTTQRFDALAIACRATGSFLCRAQEDIDLGELQMEELRFVTTTTMLRRTNEALSQGLPDKHEVLVFCRPTTIQRALHTCVVGAGQGDVLGRINMLR